MNAKLVAMVRSASEALDMHLANGFDAWCAGDVVGMHIARRGAQRCAHVIRLATALQVPELKRAA